MFEQPTTPIRSDFYNKLLTSPYLLDMSISFAVTTVSNLAFAEDKTILPKVVSGQFLVQTVTSHLAKQEVITQTTQELVDRFTCIMVFFGSYQALYENLKNAAGTTLSKAFTLGTIPVLNIVSLNNFLDIVQDKEAQEYKDISHPSETVTHQLPAVFSSVIYTGAMYVKYLLTPEKVVGLGTMLQQGIAGGAGYIALEGITNLITGKDLDIKELAYEGELGYLNHATYGCFIEPLTDQSVTFNLVNKEGLIIVLAGIIESGELVIRQHKPSIVEFNNGFYNSTSGLVNDITNSFVNDEL